MSGNIYVYCFIRKDLSVAQQIIQMAHCTYEAGTQEIEGTPSPNFVLFEVQDEGELWEVYHYLIEGKIDFQAFRESSLGGQLTSICSWPVQSEEDRAVFKRFMLYDK